MNLAKPVKSHRPGPPAPSWSTGSGDAPTPRPEPGQRHLVVDFLEHHLHRHPDVQVLVGTLDDVGVQPDPFLQLDDGHVYGASAKKADAAGGGRR
jgi:hypothetical protein